MSAFAHHDPRYPHYITALNHRHCFLRRPMRAMTKGRAQDTKKHLPVPDPEPRRCRLITSSCPCVSSVHPDAQRARDPAICRCADEQVDQPLSALQEMTIHDQRIQAECIQEMISAVR